jgi:hypothetical protein
MKKYIYALLAGILYAVFGMAQVPLNKVLNSPENGTTLHQAYLTISFDKGYSFYTNGGTLTAQITNPTVGDVLYENAIDPAAYSINTALPVKSLDEQIEVNGTLNYSVNFEVPNGAGGLQPTLGLNYMSTFNDGLLGTGFNISGLSSIDRVNKTIYHDGASLAIAGNINDAYALDGKRILLNTGTYGTNGSTYGTEMEEFSKIVAVGSSGTNEGPQSFLVYTKSGLTMEYGNTSDSRILRTGTTVLSWKLNKITDRFNNTINYSYFEYDDEKPICLISYNGGTAQIKFQYKQRSDKSNYVYGGIEFTRNILLEKIEMANNGQLFKKYEFNYMLDNCSKLLKITERSSTEQLMNPTVFSWTKQTDALNQTTHYSNSISELYFEGDFNGDGRTDLLTTPIPPIGGFYKSTDKWKLYLANTAGNMVYTSEGFLNAGTYDFMVADFNADGLSDMIVKEPVGDKENFYFYLSTGSGFNVSYKNIQANTPGVWSIVDHNGDGVLDILVRYSNTNGIKAYDLFNYGGSSYFNMFESTPLNTLVPYL